MTTSRHEVSYEINNRLHDYPRHDIDVHASQEEMDRFVEDGYVLRRGFIPPEWVREFGAAVDALAEQEKDAAGAEVLERNGLYFRRLLDKDASFHKLITYDPALSVARALLGPRVSFSMDCRYALAGVADAGVPWHMHLCVIPEPLPPFFCFPHSVHGLIYLDEIDESEGPLCVIPGSHKTPRMELDGTYEPHPEEDRIKFAPGDAVLMHGNLWHRTVPTAPGCGQRRLLLFSYAPAWLRNEVALGVPPEGALTDKLRHSDDPQLAELVDGSSVYTL
ncbi:MAG: phytanoyl-CoA dioxygenase family protein [Saccharopolyspora sp.]|uniref:phytanoyl-CoA dioxygenase family protein n=1 Tax=unclassified Saccharopolyspora TaxID=2646250 RepID=UPI0025E0F1B1|nr:phytanoyl-CoA dioxygenase family protein [Saccharopolyspora sp.]MBQ6641591.1 phytanoyl-CoA dioxygenase family protein [Saccharopolyspora sp.]